MVLQAGGPAPATEYTNGRLISLLGRVAYLAL
jgi:hypothetical protein